MNEAVFWSHVHHDNSGCWLWAGSLNTSGYAQFGYGEKRALAHRISYELLVGPIPDGLVIDHLCRVRNCVNPDHMEPVTTSENTRRGNAGKFNAAKIHCPSGHEYTPENTMRFVSGRQCRECNRARARARSQRIAQERRQVAVSHAIG